jgi:hypothetical protein
VDIFGQVNRIIRAAFTRQSANPVVDTNTTGIYADTAGLPKVVIDTSGVRTDHHIVKSSAGGDAVTITTAGPTTLSVPTSGAVATLAGTQTLTNKKLSGGTASTDNEWDIPTTNDAGEAALATTTGSIYFNTTKQKLKIRTASDWAIVGGGLIVTPLSNPTTGSSLESGKHYIIYNLASDVTLKLPAGATEATVQVSVFGNASNGYRVTVQVADVPGTDTITYGSVTGYSAAKILNPDTWATFSWDGTSAWQVDDATVALSGTFSGPLTVTGPLTPSGGIVGDTSGTAKGAGFVGEMFGTSYADTKAFTKYLSSTTETVGAETVVNTQTLNKGTYLVRGKVSVLHNTPGVTYIYFYFKTSGVGTPSLTPYSLGGGYCPGSAPTDRAYVSVADCFPVVITDDNTTFDMIAYVDKGIYPGTQGNQMSIIRIS